MKILQILPELNAGGVERGTLEVGKYLVEHGHQSLVVSNGGRLVEQLEREGSRHIQLPVHKKSLSSLGQVSVLRRLLKEEAPDILHLRSRVPAWIAWLAWRKLPPATRPRLVTTVHGFYSVNAYSAIMTRGERVICVSESVKEYVLKNYPKTPPARIRVIHRGVDPTEYPSGHRPSPEWLAGWYAEFPETEGKFLLTLPGRITRLKGHEDFIQLLASLTQKDDRFHGLIVGGTHPKKQAYAAELRQKVSDLGLGGRITFTGNRTDLREILALTDIALSLTRQPESFGRTTLEALCLGTPVAGYDHGGVGEILGALLPQGKIPFADLSALISCIQDWAVLPPQPNTRNTFTLAAMLEQTVAIYESLAHAPQNLD
jgi:glycosyltransferase involved in cell wall biosynthesis